MTEGDTGEEMGSVRWAFRCGSWTPSRSDWLLSARCVQREEKDRIGQFVFAKDAKSAMAGRLLLRKFVCERMGLPWSEIRLERSPRGKPYLAAPVKVGSDSGQAWGFNLSHQGDYAVLAAEQGIQVGVDIMKTTMPAGSEHQQLAAFYRHWALKESFIKAIGTGLGFNLQRVEFHLSSKPLNQEQVLRHTKMHLDEEEEEDWLFEESLLDADHHVAVALGPADKQGSAVRAQHLLYTSLPSSRPPPTTFTLLSFSDLIASACPLTEEDPADWENFKMKAEAPQRQRERHTST
uniref:L-aminoadipate-semialdehyde dehydrogenase-phosphopantetheinyl transferase n=1 Tax=Monopterus albus TaxID=43700 RepID=UPI0009B3DC92|nr:L-aminoadipate-semialdehyde dehydrogenase-phosphopantetheinyl transferase [Monopterus albus]